MHNTQSVPDLQERYRPSLTDEFSQKDADCFELIPTDDIVDLMPQEQKSAPRKQISADFPISFKLPLLRCCSKHLEFFTSLQDATNIMLLKLACPFSL